MSEVTSDALPTDAPGEVDAPVEDIAADVAEEAAAEATVELDTADAVEEIGAEAEAEKAIEAEAEVDGETESEAAPVREEPLSPYDLPGSWYVIHSYSGYENKVKANLETRIKSMHLEDKIFDVAIPMEEVVEFKSGRKVNVMRKKFPGYILVRLYLDDDSWYAVRNTPGVTGFVGSGAKPSPLSRREVERILGVRKDEEEKKEPRFKPAWEVGETVRVVEGPFADFNGVIEDINVDQSKVRVLVDIFGRETPVELNFDQIIKY
jgi:transcriptional antiterminator NusG